jgi:uncharacterized membrane-anchored protein
MEDHLKSCVDSLNEVHARLQSLLASSRDLMERARISEAASFISKAVAAVSHARTEIAGLPDSVKRIQ